MDKTYKWVKASEYDKPEVGVELSLMVDGNLKIGKYYLNRPHFRIEGVNFFEEQFYRIEFLKEVEPLNNWQDILKIMLDTHQEFLPNNPADHEQSELYMYMAKRISAREPLNVEDDKEMYNRGYGDGYRDASNEAKEEIRDHYHPNI